MLFYESERSDQHNYLYCQRDHNFNFPAHLHHSFEFLCVQSGTLACTLETEQYEVHPGEALLVLPDQIHSYRTIGESQSVLWVFSTDWVPEFISQLGQREFITPVFRMEAAPLMELQAAGRALPDLRYSVGTVLFAAAPRAGCGCPPFLQNYRLCAKELHPHPDAGTDGTRSWI